MIQYANELVEYYRRYQCRLKCVRAENTNLQKDLAEANKLANSCREQIAKLVLDMIFASNKKVEFEFFPGKVEE